MTDDDAIAKQLLDKLANICGYRSFEIRYDMICVFKYDEHSAAHYDTRYDTDLTYRNINGFIEILTATSYSKALKKLLEVLKKDNGTIEVFVSGRDNLIDLQNDGGFLHLKKEDLVVWLFDCVLAGCEGADVL